VNLFLLSIGAALGAMSRYKLGAIVLKHNKHHFPLGTFVINTIGALLLGIFCGFGLSGSPYLLLGDGFCGAFTTFSTFTVECVRLIQGKARKKAVLFIVLSVSAGLVCFFAGYIATHTLFD
jgi:fluoride exporter